MAQLEAGSEQRCKVSMASHKMLSSSRPQWSLQAQLLTLAGEAIEAQAALVSGPSETLYLPPGLLLGGIWGPGATCVARPD